MKQPEFEYRIIWSIGERENTKTFEVKAKNLGTAVWTWFDAMKAQKVQDFKLDYVSRAGVVIKRLIDRVLICMLKL
jgi:hypothetical protein